MANKKLPSGRKTGGRIAASKLTRVALKAESAGVMISELPTAEELAGDERFPVVQGKETRRATIKQIAAIIPAGAAGASSYDTWAEAQPEGADNSEQAFIEYIAGKPGSDGLSAYQLWANAQPEGADISEDAYFISMTGKPGSDGLSAYQIWATAQEDGADTSESAYLEFQEGKPGEPGESSYQLWINEGNEGTIADYLESQKGDAGASAYEVWAAAQPEGTNTSTEAYLNYMEGKPGNDGLSAYQIWAEEQGDDADTSLEAYLAYQKGISEIPISEEKNNGLTMKEDGLFSQDTQTAFTRVASTGAWSVNYTDDKSAANACGPMGNGCYFKRTMLVSAGSGNYNVIAQVVMISIPCLEDGTPVPFQAWAGHVESSGFAVWLTCSEIPTHTLNLSTGVISEINRYDQDSGLPDYPTIESGTTLTSVEFRTLYYYGKTV